MEYPRVIPNSDGAGIVDQVGDGVTRLEVGQRVWLFNGQRNGRAFGTAAEYIALAEHLVTPLPDNLSFARRRHARHPRDDGVVLPVRDGPIAGKTVLVTGGAGAVGHYAVQLAKWGGAQVIATVSSAAKAEQARLAGADLVVNYKTEDVVAKAMAFTGTARRRSRRRCRFRRQYRNHAEADGDEFDHRGLRHQRQPHARGADARADGEMHQRCARWCCSRCRRPLLAAAQADITKWLMAGPSASTTSPASIALSDTAQAHLAVEKGDKLGTVIVDCAR